MKETSRRYLQYDSYHAPFYDNTDAVIFFLFVGVVILTMILVFVATWIHNSA